MQDTKFTTIADYIAAQPPTIQTILKSIRKIVVKAAPDAEEVISYGMPALKQDGVLVFYPVWKTHVGFYPSGSSAIKHFANELSKYKTSKGAIQFPLDEPLPEDLITRIVKFRVEENAEKTILKSAVRKSKKP